MEQIDVLLESLPEHHRKRSGAIRDAVQASAEWIDYELIVKLVEYIERTEDPLFLDALEEELATIQSICEIFGFLGFS